jgi:hypothetical protein
MTGQAEVSGLEQSTHAPGTPALVDVHAEDDGAGGVSFSHEWRWQGGPSQGKGTIEVPKRAESDPGTPIHFHLHDDTGRCLRFTDDIQGAIWIDRSGCPNGQCGDPEIPGKKIQRTPNLLKVFNENSEECRLHYRLRFTDQQGKSESYDPDIKNGGKI